MAKLLSIGRILRASGVHLSTCSAESVPLTQQEVTTALRPLYFIVHPDLFYQFPKEKEINENSLKQMNYYLATILKNMPTNPVSLTFCLRNRGENIDSMSFKQVKIQLLGKDIHRVLHNILSTCHLSTEYLDHLQRSKPQTSTGSKNVHSTSTWPQPKRASSEWWTEAQKTAEDIEQRIRNEPDIDFRFWLNENVDRALRRLQQCQPLREETERLRAELKGSLGLKDIVWNCGWGMTHFRGCLLSFRGLAQQHPADMAVLRGLVVVFGRQTGVSFEGHVILSSEDVRNNWLEMIRSVPQYDAPLRQIPSAERSLSEALRGVEVDRRKFQPTVMVQQYTQQLGKLTSALYKHRWSKELPRHWPRRMEEYQIVVECEAGPLMLSPTGQFIVPASCPASVLVDFISENMKEADHRLGLYNRTKQKETEIHASCLAHLGLSALDKDDNITPDLMVRSCRRLLRHASEFGSNLRDLRMHISHYYCVLQDGEICIPWDWKSSSWDARGRHR